MDITRYHSYTWHPIKKFILTQVSNIKSINSNNHCINTNNSIYNINIIFIEILKIEKNHHYQCGFDPKSPARRSYGRAEYNYPKESPDTNS
jgi:hypothetical protein